MATSSITKDFIITDAEMYKKIVEVLEEEVEPYEVQTKTWKRGKELLELSQPR